MPTTHFIAHRLKKQIDDDADLLLRDSELADDGPQSSLFESLKTSFNSRVSRKHGNFDDEVQPSILAKKLPDFLDDDKIFKALTVDFMQGLKQIMDEQNGEINAHFLFFIEEQDKQKVFYLFIVNQTELLTITEQLEIAPTYSIDTGSTVCGVKVNLNDWQERPKYHYLTLVPPKGNEIFSDALHDLSGFGNNIDRAKATKAFLENVEAFASQVPEEKQKEYRETIIEYCEEQEAKDEAVDIQALSKNIEGIDCEAFVRQMLPHNPKQDEDEEEAELLIDKRSLRKYVKFSGRDRDLSITFSSFQLNDSIFYEPQDGTLLIKNLPKSLKKQLEAHVKKQ